MTNATFLTVREAAAITKVTPRTVQRWQRDGTLTVYPIGGRRLIRKSDLLKLILSSKAPSLAELRGKE
jgi:excisionase family DNA binding protein